MTDTEHLLEDLTACNHSFNVIEKSLNAYLDSKKLLFPRWVVYACVRVGLPSRLGRC